MHSRRLVKRSILGSRVYAPSPTGDGAVITGVVQAVKQENKDASTGPRRNVYTVLMQDGSLKEYSEDEIAVGPAQMTAKGPLKSSLKQQSSCNGRDHPPDSQKGEANCLAPEPPEDPRGPDCKSGDHARSVSLLEQKRKVVSSSIDVPHARKSEEEVDMDKVTAAMVLTTLSTSPLVRSPPVKVNGEHLRSRAHTRHHMMSEGCLEDGLHRPAKSSVAGVERQRPVNLHASRPSPRDSFKPFRAAGLERADDVTHEPGQSPRRRGAPRLASEEQRVDEPIPRKRKNSMKVMFKCLWKNCGKVLSTAAGIQRHIRTVHLGRNCDSECSDGEEDFYYTEIKLNTDSVADGLSSLSPVSPSVLSPPPPPPPDPRHPDGGGGGGGGAKVESSTTPLSRSAPSTLYLVHADHAYQATAPVTIPSSTNFTPSSCSSVSISWQSPPVTFTGASASPTHSKPQSFGEQRPQSIAVLSSPPRASGSLRKSRGEGKKCRKVYGMENRDMWCTACRWKKACQRFVD
ncbi:zinc finger protein 704-like [Anguilla rostrata]|uniref:zinc finger protein 704-like n=1 Tax=Anguilla rostrata TaxID=7938 RepID=UPI0030CE2E3A